MEERKTVGVVLVCIDGENRGMVPVQQRAKTEIDEETGRLVSQSSPHVLQLTFGGKVEKTESLDKAIRREAKEELGEKFAKEFDFSMLTLFHMGEFEFRDKHFNTFDYVGTLTTREYNMIELHSAAERIVWIQSLGLGYIKPKQKGVDPKKEMVMFSDQLNALRFLYSPEAAQTKKTAEIVKILV